ncbi:hypothetical protein D3C73_1575960 [compost metagenome]
MTISTKDNAMIKLDTITPNRNVDFICTLLDSICRKAPMTKMSPNHVQPMIPAMPTFCGGWTK